MCASGQAHRIHRSPSSDVGGDKAARRTCAHRREAEVQAQPCLELAELVEGF